ncbi:MgtC/SapB family protein [Clostridiaceae bacterium 35-E11]
MINTLEIIIRLSLAALLGGIIGMERESLNRPAGFRTHILVCTGSSLIMITSLFLFYLHKDFTNLDPTRLGAQIISGIGFLGAGTIIKEGSTVRGLTTAASLWVVSGMGIAIGSGFYMGAILSTILVLATLILFSKFEKFVAKKNNTITVIVNTINKPGQLGIIGTELGKLNISVINIRIDQIDDSHLSITLALVLPRNISTSYIIEKFLQLQGITAAEVIS